MKSLALALAFVGAAVMAAPHQHGVARLDIAAADGTLLITFESPLDNLVGFERAPRNDAERKRVEEMLARLRNGEALFRIDPAAQCKLVGVEIASAVLKLGTATAPAAKGDHADLDTEFSFSCAGSTPGFVDVVLFAAFPRLRQLDVQAAGPKGQSQASLKRGGDLRVPLRR